ncbi:glutaredoxin family protein [Vibrio sp. RC27]
MRNSTPQLILFSTEGCHLCHEAESLLSQLNCQFQTVDIAYDDELFSRYGVTIPVVRYAESELNWPFTLEQLQIWLNNNGVNYDS